MKVDTQRTEAGSSRAREQGHGNVADEDKARRFKKQLQRHHEEEVPMQTGIAGPFELMAALRQRDQEEGLSALASLAVQGNALPTEAETLALTSEPVMTMDMVQARIQDSIRMDTIARAAMDAGLKTAMAQDSSEYQVELGSTLFVRTRLRVRAGDNNRLEVRCESDSASEREWFGRNREALVGRMAGLTGRDVQLDIPELLA